MRVPEVRLAHAPRGSDPSNGAVFNAVHHTTHTATGSPVWANRRVVLTPYLHAPTRCMSRSTVQIFLQVAGGQISQAEAARKWQVDVSTVIGIRRTVKDAALAALARKPGRPGRQRDWQLEATRAEIVQLTEAIKAQAIELAIMRGKGSWG